MCRDHLSIINHLLSYFTVVGPRTRQHLNDYSAHLTFITSSEDELKVTVSLEGTESKEEINVLPLVFQYNEQKNITFEVKFD